MLRPKARVDRRHEVRYYRDKAGEGTATRLVSALEAAFLHLSRDPGIGSPSIGQALAIDGLRRWRLRGVPISLCYFERGSHVDVVRLVGQRMQTLWIDIDTLEGGAEES